ncbi:MAG: VOC family protein [Armatimonadetes bacterium]|nr:VOC family protein [Armatimonadota bacterium]
MQHITPCLGFQNEAQEAAEFYVSVFPNSRIVKVMHHTAATAVPAASAAGAVATVTFELNGQRFLAFNGAPQTQFTMALSLVANCDRQDEVDQLWERLAEGGQAHECGWVTDRYGISWQIDPTIVEETLRGDDEASMERMFLALTSMQKLDVAALEAAAAGR